MSTGQREADLQTALRQALAELPPTTTRGIARALERHGDRLVGGRWEDDAGDGCLLTLAARELGHTEGETLLYESVASVRVPVLFDELWATIVRRSGDPSLARAIVHRLVAEALLLQPEETSEEGTASSPLAARNALLK